MDEELAKLKGDTLDGETAFRLYDTYGGFPVDLTADVCRERDIADEAALKRNGRATPPCANRSGFGADYNGDDLR